jgi:hypothetical protein
MNFVSYGEECPLSWVRFRGSNRVDQRGLMCGCLLHLYLLYGSYNLLDLRLD